MGRDLWHEGKGPGPIVFTSKGGKTCPFKRTKASPGVSSRFGPGKPRYHRRIGCPVPVRSLSRHSPVVAGPKAFRQVMESFRSAFPDSELRIEDEIAEDDKVAIR